MRLIFSAHRVLVRELSKIQVLEIIGRVMFRKEVVVGGEAKPQTYQLNEAE